MSNFDLLKNWEINISDALGKYKIGNNTDSFEEIKHLKPVFSFDYISLKESEYCFNGNTLGKKDYLNLIKGLQLVSCYTYYQLNKEYRFHFHEIKWEDVEYSVSDFHKCVYGNQYEGETDITPYQFKVFGKARVVGFLYRGVFYLIMFDVGHNGYKRTDGLKKKKKGKKGSKVK